LSTTSSQASRNSANEFGHYDEGPDAMAAAIGEFAQAGLVNIAGGCCGTTPDHIRAISAAVAGKKPRAIPEIAPRLRLSGLEAFTLTKEIPFVNVGERTNVTGSARFRKLITSGDFAGALAVARDQVENGAQIIDVNMDEGLLDSEKAMVDRDLAGIDDAHIHAGGDGVIEKHRVHRLAHRLVAADPFRVCSVCAVLTTSRSPTCSRSSTGRRSSPRGS
jgi:hypothetical protein